MNRPPKSSSSADGSGAVNGTPAPRWSGRTRGGYWGNWFFVRLVRHLGVRWAYGWLVFVAAYFTLASPKSFRCSRDYLRRVLGPRAAWHWPLLVYRHFFAFGITLLDRLAAIMGDTRMQCRFDGEEQFVEALDRGRGVLLLGSHVGNWEMGAHLLGRLGRPVNLVVLERERDQIRRLFGEALERRQFRLLTTDEHPLRGVPILAALRRGEIVALHGDRSFGTHDLALPFLGGIARFPVGPYLLAAASGAPLFQVFAIREGIGRYRFFTYPAQYLDKRTLREEPEAFRAAVVQYVERLIVVVREHPFQWHNIYPYWEAG